MSPRTQHRPSTSNRACLTRFDGVTDVPFLVTRLRPDVTRDRTPRTGGMPPLSPTTTRTETCMASVPLYNALQPSFNPCLIMTGPLAAALCMKCQLATRTLKKARRRVDDPLHILHDMTPREVNPGPAFRCYFASGQIHTSPQLDVPRGGRVGVATALQTVEPKKERDIYMPVHIYTPHRDSCQM